MLEFEKKPKLLEQISCSQTGGTLSYEKKMLAQFKTRKSLQKHTHKSLTKLKTGLTVFVNFF